MPGLKLESGTVSSQVDQTVRQDVGQRVTKFSPNENKLQLSNGREYTYKALVVATGISSLKH
jgi:NADH dehydrogenase FAD-containing subunit